MNNNNNNNNNNRVQTRDACPPSRNCWGCAYADFCGYWQDTSWNYCQIDGEGNIYPTA